MTIKHLLFLLFTASIFVQCEQAAKTPKTPIAGNLKGGENIQIFAEKVLFNNNFSSLGKTTIGPDGDFAIEMPPIEENSVIRLRIGSKKIILPVDKGDNLVVSGSLDDFGTYDAEITGSRAVTKFYALMQRAKNRQLTMEDVSTVINEDPNPMVGTALLFNTAPESKASLPLYQSVNLALAEKMPDSKLRENYAQYVAQLEGKVMVVKVGEPAPDLESVSPDGKTYRLSDLKGKIVLLDFWASWCRPCRYENPNVVKVYEKYKNQGFTVFSVSLDQSKERWVDAIEKDNLSWEYHISDLKGWSSQPASVYKVRSIPAAYIIDQNGVIAKANVRGATEIESAIKELL